MEMIVVSVVYIRMITDGIVSVATAKSSARPTVSRTIRQIVFFSAREDVSGSVSFIPQ